LLPPKAERITLWWEGATGARGDIGVYIYLPNISSDFECETRRYAWGALKRELEPIEPDLADLGKFVMRTTRSLISNLRLLGPCFLLGFLLTPVMAVGQGPDFAEMFELASQGEAYAQYNLGVMYDLGGGPMRARNI